MVEEDSFPRGGRFVKAPKRSREDNNLFSISQVQKSKKARKAKKIPEEVITDETFHSSLLVKNTLSYDKIQDGMLILGCIRQVKELILEIELPGLTYGCVKISNISDPFTKYLNQQLENNVGENDILKKNFKIGQFIMVKVLGVQTKNNSFNVECTLNPREVNSEKSHCSFKKGMLVWGCVQSVLDHGYEVSLGVKNCRVFLPNKNVDEGKLLVIGQPLWCTVHKSETTSVATTLRVSAKEQHLKSNRVEDVDNLHDLIPGMQVELVSDKITSTGIQGKFLNNFFGYIDESQLKYPLKRPEDYSEGKLLSAYIMYIEPSTKITHLTLRSLESQNQIVHKIGEIVSAEVLSKRERGIYLKLPSEEKGFVSNRRLIDSLPKKTNLDVTETIRLKFSPGSKHQCRILDYSNFSRFYICAVDKSLVKEKHFTCKDIEAGKLVDVIITGIKPEGLTVKSGHVSGFVHNLFLSNFEYSDSIKKKFKEGQKLKARVLKIEDGKVEFTIKQGQVESDKCLKSLSDCKRGECYTGVVVTTGPTGAKVVFYNEVKGWLSKKFLFTDGDTGNMKDFFYKGQVVNAWILRVNEDQVLLSLKQPPEFNSSIKLKIGFPVKGIVAKIHKDKIDVNSKKGKLLGTIPINHLSCSLNLCSTFIKTYKVGDEIANLICVDNTSQPNILSRREAIVILERKTYKLKKFENLRKGNIIRCSYISDCESGIYVSPLILDFSEKVLVRNQDIICKDKILPKYKKYQSIVAKIVEIDTKSKSLKLTTKLDQVFDNNVEITVNLFSRYLADLNYLKKFGFNNGWDICQYSAGQRINCKVAKVAETGGCSVLLPNGAQGLVPKRLCPDGLEPGDELEGVFLDLEFKHYYAEVCLRKDVCQKINKIQNGNIKCSNLSTCLSESLIIKNDYVICVLRSKDGYRQLVYCPILLHENDHKGLHSLYEKNKLTLCISGKVEGSLIGIPKKQFLELEKKYQLKEKHIELKKVAKMAEIVENQDSNFKESNSGSNVEQKSKQEEGTADLNTSEQPVSEIEDTDIVDSEVGSEYSDKDVDDEQGVQENDMQDLEGNEDTNDSPLLPGVQNFFKKRQIEVSESSDDEDESVSTVQKKKKLTPAEKAELAKKEEERLSKIEKELADPTRPLESADQFDRKLLANPNSSEIWTRYMSYHIAMTEIDKARAVAKRALEAINITLTDERLNIWLAMMNLENMFGTKESFEKTFEDAIQCNDSLTIHLRTIEILAESGKFLEMEEHISKVKRKFKQDSKMWLEIAKVYYQINKFKEARNLKDTALKSIQDKKTQLAIIVRFAILEFKFGEEEQGAAILETILSSDPKRVDIWSVYVDQLVKKDKIDQARRVLERSISHRLPLKNMKTLFLKYRRFEEEHGTPELVDAIKERAVEYVNKVLKK